MHQIEDKKLVFALGKYTASSNSKFRNLNKTENIEFHVSNTNDSISWKIQLKGIPQTSALDYLNEITFDFENDECILIRLLPKSSVMYVM